MDSFLMWDPSGAGITEEERYDRQTARSPVGSRTLADGTDETPGTGYGGYQREAFHEGTAGLSRQTGNEAARMHALRDVRPV